MAPAPETGCRGLGLGCGPTCRCPSLRAASGTPTDLRSFSPARSLLQVASASVQRQRSYLRDVRSRLPYALVLGLLVLILVWWLDDLQSAIGLALGGFMASALTLPFTLPRGERR